MKLAFFKGFILPEFCVQFAGVNVDEIRTQVKN